MSTEAARATGATHPNDGTDQAPDRAVARWRRGTTLSDGSKIYWWREALIVVAVDLLYETIRNLSSAKPEKAYRNAERIIDWQRALGIYHEHTIQQWALNSHALIVFANYFYGSVYLAATIFGLFFLYRRHADDYPLWRNTLAIGTLLGLIGFATFPLMPPRLLDVSGIGPQNWGFVDTLLDYPTFWSFDSEGMKTISNQFAAMPSLHCGWAFWGLAVFWSRVKTWWGKALAVLYPIVTITVVVITGNHYFLDAVGGLLIFVVGYGIARLVTRSGRGAPITDAATGSVSQDGPGSGSAALATG